MSRVGILTFHTALNYGAVLQTYALQNFLKENGIENDIIDYQCPYIEKCYRPFFVSDGQIINSIVRGILFGHIIRKKRRNFNNFVNSRLSLSKKVYNTSDMNNIKGDYTYFITGSDQVWSPVSAGFDEMYFLPFADKNQKYSYAASIGTSELSNEQKLLFEQRLKDYELISVREENAKSLLTEMNLTKEIEVNVDPTLLLRKESWEALISKNEFTEPYLLIFNVEKPINDVEFAKKIAKNNNLKVVYINERTIKKDSDIIYKEAVSPEEFLSLFAHAEMVVTNSFHGTVFSIIFQKQFFVELDNKKLRNMRVESLLEQLGVKDREISENYIEKLPDVPSWEQVENILEKERKKSLNYLNLINEKFVGNEGAKQ